MYLSRMKFHIVSKRLCERKKLKYKLRKGIISVIKIDFLVYKAIFEYV